MIFPSWAAYSWSLYMDLVPSASAVGAQSANLTENAISVRMAIVRQRTTANNMQKNQHAWNALIFILYPIAIVGAYLAIDRLIGIRNLSLLSTFDIIIMTLATFRIIRLITFDKIFGFARAMFMDIQPDGTETKPPSGFRRAIAELMECQWCTGVWAGLFVIIVYMITPIGRFAALILAISALASFMQVISRRIGAK